jgi:hypothetical protein
MFTSVFTSITCRTLPSVGRRQLSLVHYVSAPSFFSQVTFFFQIFCPHSNVLHIHDLSCFLYVSRTSREFGRNSSVRIATHYGPDCLRWSGFPHRSVPTILLLHGYRVCFPTLWRPRRRFYHPPVSKAKIKERVFLYHPSPSGPSWWTLRNFTRHLSSTSRQFLLRRGEGGTCCSIVNTEFSTIRFQNATHRFTVTEVFVILLSTSVEISVLYLILGACSRAVGWGTALQAGRSRVRFPIVVIGIFHWRNPSGHTMVLDWTQPITGMSARNISRPVKAASV